MCARRPRHADRKRPLATSRNRQFCICGKHAAARPRPRARTFSRLSPLRFGVVKRVLLVLCTLTWWVLPGMGVIDLTVTWDPSWPVLLEAGWGALLTVGLGLPFLVAAVRPRVARAALVQVYAVTAALFVGALVGREPQTWWLFVMIAIEVPLLHLTARGTSLGTFSFSPVLCFLGLIAMAPALSYAWDMAAANRLSLVTSDITNDTDHYAVQAAVGLTLVALPLVASLWPSTRRLLGTSTTLMAAYLGLLSYSWPDAEAGFSQTWSVAVMVWAGAIGLSTWWPSRRRTAPASPTTAAAS